jgi:hypothetical protein
MQLSGSAVSPTSPDVSCDAPYHFPPNPPTHPDELVNSTLTVALDDFLADNPSAPYPDLVFVSDSTVPPGWPKPFCIFRYT